VCIGVWGCTYQRVPKNVRPNAMISRSKVFSKISTQVLMLANMCWDFMTLGREFINLFVPACNVHICGLFTSQVRVHTHLHTHTHTHTHTYTHIYTHSHTNVHARTHTHTHNHAHTHTHTHTQTHTCKYMYFNTNTFNIYIIYIECATHTHTLAHTHKYTHVSICI